MRILHKQKYFKDYSQIVDSLVRQVGLMPYVEEQSLGFKDSLAYEFFKPLNDDEGIVFHRMQAEIYHKLQYGENVILSAPTSFGKSKIIDSIIGEQNECEVLFERHSSKALLVASAMPQYGSRFRVDRILDCRIPLLARG